MTSIGEGVATNLALRLVDKAIKEVNYLRHFETHVYNFVIENNDLDVKRKRVQKDIEDAERRNEDQIEDDVQNWIEEANNLIRGNTRIKRTWSYGWCPYWQYRQGKKLAQRTLAIKDHIQKCNFGRVARPAKLPGITYHSSPDFINFESRKSKFEELVKALEDGNHYMIGLQGMGGTGKTTLATQVGKQVEESKAFQKVIFTVVSTPPDIKKIQADIARQLRLHLEQGRDAEHSELLWSRIAKYEGRLLIILDDVWEELNLKNIGIPFGHDHKNCCILVTARHSRVCQAMKCQQIICLQTLTKEDALELFMLHARSNDGSSNNDLEGVAPDFVKECGGLPVVIEAVAKTLKYWPSTEWKVRLTTLQNSEPLLDVDEELTNAYKSLRLSYDNLRDERAKKLFLLCSIFPEDHEILISLIIRLAIGVGIFGEFDKYYVARSQALAIKNELISSSLLLKVEMKECVKMHDLIREVALWIAKEDIQVIMDPRTTLKADKRFLFCSGDDFPTQLDGSKIEILFLWINGNAPMTKPEAFFTGLTKLKVLYLLCKCGQRFLPPLSLSHVLSKNIRSVIMNGWKLDDFSAIRILQCLETLELENCKMTELPKEIWELKKLRSLGLRKCEIERNNPFEVIGKCSQLEELYFVSNKNVEDLKPKNDRANIDDIAHDKCRLELQMYSIACSGFEYFPADDNGLLKCLNVKHVKNLISEGMFKYFVGRAEILELGETGEIGWKNLIPDIIPMEDGGMNDLIKLCLYQWADIECLIDTSKHRYSDVLVFSKLVELHLDGVDVKELYWGPMPSEFLKQLQILNLENCKQLQNIFFHGNLKLPHLKALDLVDCPMFQPSIFQPSVARSLTQLEELRIESCEELKTLIAYESLEEEIVDVGNQRSYGLLFPKLKSLQIWECGKLELLSPLLLAGDLPFLEDLWINTCEELKYIFGEYRDDGQPLHQEIMLPSLAKIQLQGVQSPSPILKDDSKEKHPNSKTSLSWAHGCCFQPTATDTDIVDATLQHHTISQR